MKVLKWSMGSLFMLGFAFIMLVTDCMAISGEIVEYLPEAAIGVMMMIVGGVAACIAESKER